MGQGLQSRLKQKGIMAMCTPETDPDAAVQAWLSGTLAELPAELHDHGHEHDDSHHQHHHHGAPTQEVIGMQSVDQLFSNMFRK
jgi:predicted Fe-Mo cluster-binding NifX family protein